MYRFYKKFLIKIIKEGYNKVKVKRPLEEIKNIKLIIFHLINKNRIILTKIKLKMIFNKIYKIINLYKKMFNKDKHLVNYQ